MSIDEQEKFLLSWKLIQRLMNCFNGSFINQQGEFIAHEKANEYFILSNCKNEFDIQCKFLERFSRSAFKTSPFRSEKKNKEFHCFMRTGINQFLGTGFSEDEMAFIYTYLGNACNHSKTQRFIKSGYDFDILKAEKKKNDGKE